MSDEWMRFTRPDDGWALPLVLPGPVRTARTVVRRWALADAPALFRAIDESRDAILPWMLWALSEHRALADTEAYITKHLPGEGSTDFPIGIFDGETGAVIGSTGLHQADGIRRCAEIGWWLHPERRGQGLCREAVAGLIGSALAPAGWGLHRLYALVAVPNAPSRGVCEALGLRLEARLQRERYLGLPEKAPHGWLDVLQYAVLAEEWRAAEGRAEPRAWPHEP